MIRYKDLGDQIHRLFLTHVASHDAELVGVETCDSKLGTVEVDQRCLEVRDGLEPRMFNVRITPRNLILQTKNEQLNFVLKHF